MCTRNVFTVFIVFFFTGLFFTGCENPVQTRGPAGTKYALVMEGGGVRGIISAQFLKLLEEQVLNSLGEERNTTPKFFDLISGSSIGGIHALFLGIDESKASDALKKLLVDEKGAPLEISGASLLNLYEQDDNQNIKDIFKISDRGSGLGYIADTAIETALPYLVTIPSHKPEGFASAATGGVIYPNKGEVLKKLYGLNMTFGSLAEPVFIPTYDYANHELRYFSSYDSSDKSVSVWELAEATSAAPIYFSPVTVTKGEEKMYLMDGTLISNNTCMNVYNELANQFPNDYIKILSVSSGHFVDKMKKKNDGTHTAEEWKKKNTLAWVLGGGKIIERLVSVPSFLSTLTCERTLKDNFMHIGFAPPSKGGYVPITDIDDIRPKTLNDLKEGAKKEFEKVKDDLRTFLLPDTL